MPEGEEKVAGAEAQAQAGEETLLGGILEETAKAMKLKQSDADFKIVPRGLEALIKELLAEEDIHTAQVVRL